MRFRTRRMLIAVVGFCVGTTVGYPIEHLLYNKVFPFTWIGQVLDLH